MSVGLCELRDRLISRLAQVRAGRVVAITGHDRPAARVVPVGTPNALKRLVAEGRVEPARRPKRPAERGVRASGSVSDVVAAQRRDADHG